MDEYIPRSEAIAELRHRCYPCGEGIEAINGIPAADVAPVVHGRWVEHFDEMECPVCKRQWNYCDNDTNTFNFCPNCGAKMDGGDNDAVG